jgi:hypothetical protein
MNLRRTGNPAAVRNRQKGDRVHLQGVSDKYDGK